MHILILNWRDIKHPLAGGAEISLFEHAKYWKKNGARVVWFASFFPGGKKEEEIEGIKILRAGSHHSVHLLAFLYYTLGRFGKPNVVVDCFHFLPFFSPLYFKKAKIVALINEVAGKVWFSNIFFPLSLIGYLIEPLFFIFYRQKQFITSSGSTKKELIKFGIPLKNINVVYHGVTTKKMGNEIVKEEKPTIIFLGRLSKDKGIKDALKVFSNLENRVTDLKLWIVGHEEENMNLNKYNSQITYYGYVDQDKKFELLKRAWILIHPSKKEGWGLTVIEAASQGTPTVGYNTEGLRDSILDGKTGLLADPNPESLTNEVYKLILDEKLYNRLRLGAMDWAGRFSWEESNSKSWDVIKKESE